MDKKVLALIIVALVAVVIAAATIFAGGSDEKKDPEPIHATGIMIDRATLSLEEGVSYTLKATVIPAGCTDPVVWSSSDVSVCTVTDGKVVGVKSGSATVTAQCGNEKASCSVEVKAKSISATGIMIDMANLSLEEGGSYTLKATVIPAGCTDPVVWSSSDVSVCTVTDGKVVGVKSGSATVTAQCGNEKASCSVEVRAISMPATGIMLNKASLYLYPSGSSAITATVIPEGSTDKVVWTSSDTSVCTVSDGLVTALKDGTCTITATAGKESATCTVTVYKPASTGELNALSKAKSYVSSLGISKVKLKDFLLDYGFTESEATYGVDNCGADWNQEALQQARSYMSSLSIPKSDLKKYLLNDNFTDSEAQYAVNILFP